jgi:hypothetical protein
MVTEARVLHADEVRRAFGGGLADTSSRLIAAHSPNFFNVRDEAW